MHTSINQSTQVKLIHTDLLAQVHAQKDYLEMVLQTHHYFHSHSFSLKTPLHI